MPLACGMSTGAASYTLIDNFEDGDDIVGNETTPQARAGMWFVGHTGCSEAPTASVPAADPDNGTDYAAWVGDDDAEGCERVWLGLDLNRCEGQSHSYNAAAYRGITFRYKSGPCTLRVSVSTYSTLPTEEGGGCAGAGCGAFHTVELFSSGAWTTDTVTWADLAADDQPPGSFGAGQIMAIYFQGVDCGTSYKLWIDDVAFLE